MVLELDALAVQHAVGFRKAEGLILGVLIELLEIDGLRVLGFKGAFEYCQRRLMLSNAQSYYYQKVAKKSVEVPALKKAIEDGVLSLSEARRIEPVVTIENCEEWIQKVRTMSQRELEKAVSQVNPRAAVKDGIKPLAEDLNQLYAGISEAGAQEILRAQDLLSQKKAEGVSLGETLEAAARFYNEKHDPVRRAERVLSSRKAKETYRSTKLVGRKISAVVRHEVNLRDRGKCTVVGCNQTRWIEFHHVREVAKGGENTVENLTTLCHFHHRETHATGLRAGG